MNVPAEYAELVAWVVETSRAAAASGHPWQVVINAGAGNRLTTEFRQVREDRDEAGRRVRVEQRVFGQLSIAPSQSSR